MIVTVIYFIAFCAIVYYTTCFGVFSDTFLSKRILLFAFVFKCTGIIAFYYVYAKFYGGIQTFDTQHFYNDSKVIHDVAFWDAGEFIRLLFGLHDESADTVLFKNYLSKTNIWDTDSSELMYNDNRLVLRLHALIHFVSFGKYGVHALFSCFMGFVGIVWIYKSFRHLFAGKEPALFAAWVAFPGLWFWSSSVLKEGPALFLMGALFLGFKKVILDGNRKPDVLLGFLITVTGCFFLKHYLMLPLLFLSAVYFLVISAKKIKYVSAVYVVIVFGVIIAANAGVKLLFGKTAVSVLAARQHTFKDVSKGGIFLLDSEKFVRLPYEYNLLNIDSVQTPPVARIKKDVAFIYWEHHHQQDTLLCKSNDDTLTAYEIKYVIVPAHSTVNVPALTAVFFSLLKAIPSALYVTTLKPFFFDSRGMLDTLASVENAIILLSLLYLLYNFILSRDDKSWPFYFLSLALAVLIIAGLTSPNIGAIERYRAPVIPFLMMGALWFVKADGKQA